MYFADVKSHFKEFNFISSNSINVPPWWLDIPVEATLKQICDW